ncbi:MAG TPA: hypothetical protein PLT75_17795 [Spirochaetota bacterium]|nr:hypothetical protein [Spirochaetota bacterium]
MEVSEESRMGVNQDFRDLFRIFNEENVEYIIVGAHAVIFYAEPRYTKDIDVWINPSPDNAKRVMNALEKFGAPLDDVSINDFTDPDLIYQIGVEPNRIDIMMGIAGVTFEQAYCNSEQATYGDVPVHILGRQELLTSKKTTARLQDLIDIENLEDADS